MRSGKTAMVMLMAICLLLYFSFATAFAGGAREDTEDAYNLLFLGYGEGSAGTITTAKVSELILNELPPGSNARTTVGGSIGNLFRLAEGDADVVATVATFVAAAHNKAEPIPDGLPMVRSIGQQAVHGSPFWIVARKDSGIESFDDMKNRSFNLTTRERGTTGELFARYVFAAHGIDYDNIRSWGGNVVHTTNAEATGRMRDGHSDVWVAIGAWPFGPLLELATATNVVLIPYDMSIIEDFHEKHLFSIERVPAGTYPGQNEEYVINGSVDWWVTRDDVPEEVVYAFLAAIYNNEAEFRATHRYAEMFEWENAASIPYLHSGAEKFYREKGILK